MGVMRCMCGLETTRELTKNEEYVVECGCDMFCTS